MSAKPNAFPIEPARSNEEALEREEAQPMLAVGQWYWVRGRSEDDDASSSKEWFGCVMTLGSNYALLRRPSGGDARIHFDNVATTLRFEPNPAAVIQSKVTHFTRKTNRLMGKVRDIMARLGLQSAGALPAAATQGSDTALVVMSGQADMSAYKAALIEAQDETLPALFDEIKSANARLAEWMTADTLPLKASVTSMENAVGEIKDRIFNVSLYAGLVEDAVCCSEGAAAPAEAKLHVMQRRLHMDEECLLNYTAGGMEFSDIQQFDAWLAQPENRDRVLPFPRTLVAMRVRRAEKAREMDGGLLSAFINVHLAKLDETTFLYVRNGEQLWRINCEMDFGAMIFPDKAIYDPSEPQMFRTFCNRIDEIVSRGEYEARMAEAKRKNERSRWDDSFDSRNWHPLDSTSVYFDDAMATLSDKVKEFNRIAVIIQGLFDRSPVLHPHAPVRTWTPDGFARAIQLVYDAHMVLDAGPAPDFEAYRARCNAELRVGSITAGQDLFWEREMAKKEMARRALDYRLSSHERYREIKYWQPDGNPGPGKIAVVRDWQPRRAVAKFAWTRQRWTRTAGFEDLPASIRVPAAALLNVSAYKPGDYLQFYRDHRTRAQYLQWAPLLLAAEDYYAEEKLISREDQ